MHLAGPALDQPVGQRSFAVSRFAFDFLVVRYRRCRHSLPAKRWLDHEPLDSGDDSGQLGHAEPGANALGDRGGRFPRCRWLVCCQDPAWQTSLGGFSARSVSCAFSGRSSSDRRDDQQPFRASAAVRASPLVLSPDQQRSPRGGLRQSPATQPDGHLDGTRHGVHRMVTRNRREELAGSPSLVHARCCQRSDGFAHGSCPSGNAWSGTLDSPAQSRHVARHIGRGFRLWFDGLVSARR